MPDGDEPEEERLEDEEDDDRDEDEDDDWGDEDKEYDERSNSSPPLALPLLSLSENEASVQNEPLFSPNLQQKKIWALYICRIQVTNTTSGH